jgi:hypothetical protein
MTPKEIFNKLRQVITIELQSGAAPVYSLQLRIPTSEDAFGTLPLATKQYAQLWSLHDETATCAEWLYSIPISKLCRALDGLRTMKIVVYGKSVRDIRTVQTCIKDMLDLSEYIKELPPKHIAYYDSKLRGLYNDLPGRQVVSLRQDGLNKLGLSWEQVFPCEDIETIKRQQ